MKTIHVRGLSNGIPVGTIYCLGRNYAEHAKEMHNEIPTAPIIFLKPSNAIIHDCEDIIRPSISKLLHHEVELVVALGKSGKNISEEKAHEYILGYGVGLDMTLRDLQREDMKKGLPWNVAKGFDTSAPVSEIIPSSNIKNPGSLEIRCSVNGALRQHTSADKMIFSVPNVITYLSSIFTLERGDLIFTGTPEGVEEVKEEDTIEAELVGWTKIHHQVKVG